MTVSQGLHEAKPDAPPNFTRQPFTYKTARAAGISRTELTNGTYRRLLWGVHISADVPVDAWVEAKAALLAAQAGAFVSHHTAARLWGGVVPDVPFAHVSVPTGTARSDRQDLVVHSSSRQPQTFRGVSVTSPLDTFLDCATTIDLVDLVILGDRLVKKDRISLEELVQGCAAARGRGCRRARRAASLVRAGVDSVMETRARLLRVLSGLPELETDIRFYDEQGNLLRRLDAGDRATRTAVEYDGRHHVNREETWEADIGRREEFEDLRWRIVTLVSKDIFVTPAETVERLRRIFRLRGMTVGPRSDEWRRYFRGHG